MKINLNDWLGNHLWAWWLVVALLCSGADLVAHTGWGRILAAGALAAALTAVAAPRTPALQAGVALVVAGVLTVRSRGYRRE